jgi:hypothetical protein
MCGGGLTAKLVRTERNLMGCAERIPPFVRGPGYWVERVAQKGPQTQLKRATWAAQDIDWPAGRANLCRIARGRTQTSPARPSMSDQQPLATPTSLRGWHRCNFLSLSLLRGVAMYFLPPKLPPCLFKVGGPLYPASTQPLPPGTLPDSSLWGVQWSICMSMFPLESCAHMVVIYLTNRRGLL